MPRKAETILQRINGGTIPRATDRRPSARERGYDARWEKARRWYLKENPVCICGRAATVVDHVVPHKGDAERFWQTGNWQALCKHCHDRKTAREDGGFGRAKHAKRAP